MDETMEIRCICVPVVVRAGGGGREEGLSSRNCRSKRHAGTGNMGNRCRVPDVETNGLDVGICGKSKHSHTNTCPTGIFTLTGDPPEKSGRGGGVEGDCDVV